MRIGEATDRAVEVIDMAAINRRTVLATSAASAVAASISALVGAPAATAAFPAAKTTKSLLARSRWAAQLGAGFTMTSPVSSWQVRLEAIDDLLPVLEVADPDRFSLTFSSTQPGPPQGTFRISRPGFEVTPLFLIPDGERRGYVAIVNRI